MAEFAQSAASRAALQDAARSYLRSGSVISALAGTSDKKATAYKTAQRRVQRWTTTAKEQRKPSKAALAKVGKVQVSLKADFDYGGDPAYHRDKKPMHTMGDGLGADFFAQALNNPDEAWEMFLDNYGVVGTVENVRDIRFS